MYVLQHNGNDEYFYDFTNGSVVTKSHLSRAATFQSVARALEAIENYNLEDFDIVIEED